MTINYHRLPEVGQADFDKLCEQVDTLSKQIPTRNTYYFLRRFVEGIAAVEEGRVELPTVIGVLDMALTHYRKQVGSGSVGAAVTKS